MDRIRRVVSEKLVPSGSLRQRAIKGSLWLFGRRGVGRALNLVKLAILARLLAPTDFGLMGIALLTLAILQQFSRLGFNTALVQRQEDDVDPYLDTVWALRFTRGVVLSSIMLLSAPFVAQVFSDPRITDLVRVLAVVPLLQSLTNPGVVYFTKDLEFHRSFAYHTAGNVADFVAALVFALISPTVWALVVGTLFDGVVKLAGSYLLHDYRPSFRFDVDKARELIGFGKWITASGILHFLVNQGDDLFVGWFLGSAALGFYQMAFRFGNAPATEISYVVSTSLLSTYSEVQEGLDRIRDVFVRAVRLVAVVALPMAVGISIVAEPFVSVFLGTQWVPMVVALQILACWGAIRAISGTYGSLFDAIGRPDYGAKLSTVRLLVLAVLVYPATATFGFEGTAGAVLASGILPAVLGVVIAAREVDVALSRLLPVVLYPLIAAMVMGAIVYAVRETLAWSSSLWGFGVLVILGVGTYVMNVLILELTFEYHVTDDVLTIVETFRA